MALRTYQWIGKEEGARTLIAITCPMFNVGRLEPPARWQPLRTVLSWFDTWVYLHILKRTPDDV